MSYKIDWSEHPKLRQLDTWVANAFSDRVSGEFSDTVYKDTYCIHDVKHNAKRWIEDRIELLKELTELVNALPDDEQIVYTMDDEADEIVEDEEVLE